MGNSWCPVHLLELSCTPQPPLPPLPPHLLFPEMNPPELKPAEGLAPEQASAVWVRQKGDRMDHVGRGLPLPLLKVLGFMSCPPVLPADRHP